MGKNFNIGHKVTTSFGIAALLLSLAACGGGGAESSTQTKIKTTTVGQELVDLKKALDSGALSKSDYEDQRRKILDRQD